MALLKTKNNVVREQKICFAYALEPLFVFACFQLLFSCPKEVVWSQCSKSQTEKKKKTLQSWTQFVLTEERKHFVCFCFGSLQNLLIRLALASYSAICFVRCFQLDLNTLKTITFVVLVLYRNPSLLPFLVKDKNKSSIVLAVWCLNKRSNAIILLTPFVFSL